MSNNAQEQLSLLTPGSVWLSPKGKPSFVLFITNENIPAAKQAQFPPQVIFADEEGELYNVNVDKFLDARSFHHVEPDLETKIENLLVMQEEPSDEEHDNGDAVGATDVQMQSHNQSILDLEEAAAASDVSDAPVVLASRNLKATFQFDHTDGLEDPVLSGHYLATALRSYSQEPSLATAQIIHRLTFMLDAECTLESLNATFSDVITSQQHRRHLHAMTVQAHGNIEPVIWNQFNGVYPVFTDGGAYGVVLLAQDVTFDEAETEEVGTEDDEDDGHEAAADTNAEMAALTGDAPIPTSSIPQAAEAFVAAQAAEAQPEVPAEQPVEQPGQQPAEVPAEQPAEVPAQQPQTPPAAAAQ